MAMVKSKTAGSKAVDILLVLFMVPVILLFVYPFLYIVLYSVSDISKLETPFLIYPVGFNVDSYTAILTDGGTFNAIIMSLARCIIAPLGMLIVSGMMGYALTRRDLIFGKAIRMYLLFSMYISAGMIPNYLNIKNLGLTNSFWVYVIPGLVSIFNVMLIKTYILSLPHELEEAVKIDGGTEIDAYFRVILPLCLPVNAAVVLFSVIGNWNSYFDVSMYNGAARNLHTLSYTLYLNLSAAQNISLEKLQEAARMGREIRVNKQSINMAMTVITMVPPMCVHPLLRKYFASGLLIGAVKM